MASARIIGAVRRIGLGISRSRWPSNNLLTPTPTPFPWWSSNNLLTPCPWWSSNNPFSTNTGHDFHVADLLSTPERDFLLKNNDQKVPISSLKGKLVGLYFCDNIPHPPRMQAIKQVYEEAKLLGYDFEIVQITFHYRCSNAAYLGIDPAVRQCSEDISWLTLPFMDPMDPSCKKIQRIFESVDVDDEDVSWVGDSLVLVYPRQAYDSSGVLFEFSGAEILEQWGIQGYPFTRPSLYKLHKRNLALQWLFPPGECLLRCPRSAGHGFDLVDAFSQLSGKRVIVLFAPHVGFHHHNDYIIRMLKSEYHAQLEDHVAEENKFEVVYVSTDSSYRSQFDEYTKDMPWLVQPFSPEDWIICCEAFTPYPVYPAVVAFNEQGELIAKEDCIREKKEGDKLRFPFIDQDLEKHIRRDVDSLCDED